MSQLAVHNDGQRTIWRFGKALRERLMRARRGTPPAHYKCTQWGRPQ